MSDTDIQIECGKAIAKYLMASYAYYILNQSVMPDTEYDQLARFLLEHYDEFEHQHKYLVTKEDLQAGTLFTLKDEDYPMMVKGGVTYWLEAQEEENQAKIRSDLQS